MILWDRVRTEWNVLRWRVDLIARGAVHLWQFPFDFEMEHALATFRWRLARLEKVLAKDEFHENAEERAKEVRAFLDLLDEWESHIERCAKSPEAKAVLDRWPGHALSGEAVREWAHDAEEYRLRAWYHAWLLFYEKSPGWWS